MKRAVLAVMGLVLAAVLVVPSFALALDDPLAAVGNSTLCLAIPIFAADAPPSTECPSGQVPDWSARGGPIVWYAVEVMKLISLIIGGVIVLVIVIAGINYITSAGNPNGVKTAKKRIQNAVVALILYMSMFAIINFLVPGGLLIG